MCTVTLIPRPDGYRLAVNRDEQRTRPPAEPPHTFTLGPRKAIYPKDPQGGGTWIAVNDAGLALTLLNLNETPAETTAPTNTQPMRSRGIIIPQLAIAATVGEALALADELDPTEFSPFRLLLIDDRHTGTVRSNGHTLEHRKRARPSQPLMLTSSGLGDSAVDGPRRALFDQSFGPSPADWPDAQDNYHRQRWADRREVSVDMSRDDARTVCWSAVTVNTRRVEMSHRNIDQHEHWADETHRLCMARAAAVPSPA